MDDYYKSEDFANNQLYVGRKIGMQQAAKSANRVIENLTDQANQRIGYLNQQVEDQAIKIQTLEAQLSNAMVALSVTRDTLDTYVAKNPSALEAIANIFKGFYIKHSQAAINDKRLRVDPLKSGAFKSSAPKTYNLFLKFFNK